MKQVRAFQFTSLSGPEERHSLLCCAVLTWGLVRQGGRQLEAGRCDLTVWPFKMTATRCAVQLRGCPPLSDHLALEPLPCHSNGPVGMQSLTPSVQSPSSPLCPSLSSHQVALYVGPFTLVAPLSIAFGAWAGSVGDVCHWVHMHERDPRRGLSTTPPATHATHLVCSCPTGPTPVPPPTAPQPPQTTMLLSTSLALTQPTFPR